MDKYSALENLANGIHAANKIKDIKKTFSRSDSRSVTNNVELISQILQSLAEYSPRNYRSPLSEANSKCRAYCDTYRNFKQYLKAEIPGGISKERFISSLSILDPILDDHKRIAVRKIMQIYNLFK